MSNPSIRTLTPTDVPHVLALSRLVGWNQTAEDWRLAIQMNPGGCFAIESDGIVVATTTSIRYGTVLAWVGMVLTHPEYRGRGYARRLVERVLDHLDGVDTVKLDATEMGMPLYRQMGFVEECAIERWIRTAQETASPAVGCYQPDVELDLEAFGADRGDLLGRLSGIGAASLPGAFAMGRGNRFGPCISRSKEAVETLAQWFLSRRPNDAVLWDQFPENGIAQSLGFERFRTLTRMSRGRVLHGNQPLIYAGAGFEFG